MKSVDEHLAGILGALTPLAPLDLALLEARGAVLAETVAAPVSLPPFDNSAMDGYAVCSADLVSASPETPVALQVVGEVLAGDQGVYGIRPGLCTRIMTGAPMPGGADAVVPVEWTDGGTVQVRISRTASAGNYIRRTGEDVVEGQVVVPPGTPLGAAQLGMLASLGRSRVLVRPRPRVVVLSTGSELREPGSPLAHGQIWDSNSFMLTAAVAEAGGVGYRQQTVGDEPDKVLEAVHDQLTRADALITSGGVSMGARDVVKEAFSGAEARLTSAVEFTKVAMRPGKPQGFGLVGDAHTPIFTLPGNPVSAYVSFQVFVRPALRALQGLPPEPPTTVTAEVTADLRSPAGIRHYLRGVLSFTDERATGGPGYVVVPAEGQGSHQMAALATANALIVIREDLEFLPAGSHVEVLRLPR
jgi:molybdenum cofactor synthesis domain-containing protein